VDSDAFDLIPASGIVLSPTAVSALADLLIGTDPDAADAPSEPQNQPNANSNS
jgi:hypothetical protein